MRLVRLVAVLLLVALPALAKDGESRFAPFADSLVHYKTWGRPTAPAVILVHGFTLDHAFWREQIPALAKTHRVIAMDSPGHGQSGKPADAVYTMDYYARAVEAVAADAGVTKTALIGHSMGLPVIHTVLRRGKLPVTKAVFVDGAIVMGTPEDKKFLDEFLPAVRSPEHRVAMAGFFQAFTPKVPAAWRKEIDARLRAYDQHMAVSTLEHFADADVWAPARHDVPVLALYAAMSQQGVKDWLEAHYPKAKLVVWDDVDHFPQIEQPKRVNKAIAGFLR